MLMMTTRTTALLAALSLALAAPALAQTAADQPASGTSPSGGRDTGGIGTQPTTISQDDLRSYVATRQAIERRDPGLASALRSGDLTGREQEVSSALAATGSQMSVEEFERIHQQVRSDPALEARVESEMGAPGRSGTERPGQGAPLPSGALGTGPAAGTGQTPPGTQQPGLGAGAPTTEQPDGGRGGAASGSSQ